MRFVIFSVSIMVACASVAHSAVEPLPTAEEAHQLFDQKQYPQVLQKLQRLLALKGEAAKPYDRHDLLRLRGETHLRTKAAVPAAQAFAEAGDAAADPNDAALDKATELLIRRSPNLSYMPKTRSKTAAPAGPIAIVDVDGRKRGLSALFEDEWAAAEPRIKALRDGKQLPPIMAVVPAIKQTRMLEVAATGTDERTKKLTADLSTHAHDLMAAALTPMARATDDIEKLANEYIQQQVPIPAPAARTVIYEMRWRKRGLEFKQQTALKEVMATCAKIIPAAKEMAEALGAKDAAFETVRTDAEKIGRKAEKVLNDDYTQLHVTRPG